MKPIAFANSLSLLSFAAFLICIIWALVHQDSFVAFWNSWVHGFNLELLVPEDGLSIISFSTIFGLISFTVSSWIAGYFIAWLYNRFAK